MKLATFIKQPGERESYTIDYADDLTDGDGLASAAAVVSPTGLTIDTVTVVDTRVKVWATGGTAGTSYKVTVTTTTDDGRIIEDEITIKVKEF